MKYINRVDINAPIEKVIAIFEDPEMMGKWQDGFQSFKHLSGEIGKPGAISEIHYLVGPSKQELYMTETIKVMDLPREFSAIYECDPMDNIMTNWFEELGENKTRWNSEIEYTRIGPLMMKIIAAVYPAMFKKQSQKWMDNFKRLVESEN